MSVIAPGTCRHCGCTEDNACILPSGDPCCWLDAGRTVCSRSDCILQEKARVKALMPQTRGLYAGWGYGAIVDDLRRRRRKARRGKRRAA